MSPSLQIEVTSNIVTRIAPKAWLDSEDNWLNFPESLHRFAPARLGCVEIEDMHHRQEEHMGKPHSMPEIMLQDWWDARLEYWIPQPAQTKTLRQWLKTTPPHGKLNVLDFRRALQENQIENPPSKKQLERALNTSLEIIQHRGPIHGQLSQRRVREQGFITWRNASLNGLRGIDVAPFLPVNHQPSDVLVAMIKWGWFHDPVKALEAMHALNIIPEPFPAYCNVIIQVPIGFDQHIIEQIIGCSPGENHTHKARKGLYRASKIQLGGQEICMTTTPPLPPLKDSAFFLPRHRQPTDLFERFHQGILLDEEGRYSLTPERHAIQIAAEVPHDMVYDAFAGCGGNTIAFARSGKRVIANEYHPERLQMAMHNASIYNVEQLIDWQNHDALQHFPEAPFVFLDPPWVWGNSRLQEILDMFQRHYSAGQIKVPISFLTPKGMTVQVYCTEEHFPSFLVLQWSHS